MNSDFQKAASALAEDRRDEAAVYAWNALPSITAEEAPVLARIARELDDQLLLRELERRALLTEAPAEWPALPERKSLARRLLPAWPLLLVALIALGTVAFKRRPAPARRRQAARPSSRSTTESRQTRRSSDHRLRHAFEPDRYPAPCLRARRSSLGVISTAPLGANVIDLWRGHTRYQRTRKLVARYIGFLFLHRAEVDDPHSLLRPEMSGTADIDGLVESLE